MQRHERDTLDALIRFCTERGLTAASSGYSKRHIKVLITQDGMPLGTVRISGSPTNKDFERLNCLKNLRTILRRHDIAC